jgi:hypothetical protein
MSNGLKRWFPNLKGIADPKKAFEVQTADSMHQVMTYVYDINDRLGKMAPPASAPGPAAASGAPAAAGRIGGVGPAGWWESPYAVDGFSGNASSSVITINWSNYRIAPVIFESRKTQYVNVPPGSISTAGGTLSSNTSYFFFPAWDVAAASIVWAIDPATVVAGCFAHTQLSPVALVRSSIGQRVPLSMSGISVKTNEGSFTGRGGGLITGLKK